MYLNYISDLPEDRWEEFKILKLEAVKENPIIFSETEQEIIDREEKQWKLDLKESIDKKNVFMFVESDGKLIAMAIAHYHKREKMKHNAFFSNLHVSKEYRGQGIGKALVEKRIELAKINSIKNIICEIFEFNSVSIEMHEKMGFKHTGMYIDLCHHEGKYYNSSIFEKQI